MMNFAVYINAAAFLGEERYSSRAFYRLWRSERRIFIGTITALTDLLLSYARNPTDESCQIFAAAKLK